MRILRYKNQRKFAAAWGLAATCTLLMIAPPAARAGRQPGQLVWDFSTVLRRSWWNEDSGKSIPAGTTVTLNDFNGKILFIEFFDPYCSICTNGLQLTTSQIKDYYKSRKGNAHGVPVVYMAINLDSEDYAQYQADFLLDEYSVALRGNDYTSTQTDVAVNIFASHTSKPVFVAINCAANSPGHQQGELLLNTSGVVESQIPGLITTWKNVIDSVQAPLPKIESEKVLGDGSFEFVVQGQMNSNYIIEGTTDFLHWDTFGQYVGTNGPIVFRENNQAPEISRFFRVIRSP